MSLLRAITRVSAVGALLQSTFAGAQVFDSDQMAFATAVQGQAKNPYITVYTDTDDRMPSRVGTSMGREILNGDSRSLCLVLEMAVASAVAETVDGQTVTVLKFAPTDPGMEFAMDLMEMQCISALFTGNCNQWGSLLRRIVQRITRMPSRRGGQAQSGVRFAARRTTFMCTTIDDVMQGQTLPDNHPINEFIALCNKYAASSFGNGKIGDYAELVSGYMSGGTALASWQVTQGLLGMTQTQVRMLNPDGIPLPYPPIEQPPFDWSDKDPNAPSLEEIILMGGTVPTGTPVLKS